MHFLEESTDLLVCVCVSQFAVLFLYQEVMGSRSSVAGVYVPDVPGLCAPSSTASVLL